MAVQGSANRLGFGVKLRHSGDQSAYGPMVTNGWAHLVGAYKQGQFVQLWHNGSLIQSNAIPDEPIYYNAAFPLRSAIGAYHFVPGPYEGFHGTIDDIRIYKRALSNNEVQQLHQLESSHQAYQR
jgi:hypothetical protein